VGPDLAAAIALFSIAPDPSCSENIHLQPYASEADFYERIYPKYLALLEKAKQFMEDTGAEPGRTIVLISAGFDACEHEYQAMQRHDRRVPVSRLRHSMVWWTGLETDPVIGIVLLTVHARHHRFRRQVHRGQGRLGARRGLQRSGTDERGDGSRHWLAGS
jgi:hypothetical protein